MYIICVFDRRTPIFGIITIKCILYIQHNIYDDDDDVTYSMVNRQWFFFFFSLGQGTRSQT